MNNKIKKLKRYCKKNGLSFEEAPKSLTGLHNGYLIIDESMSTSNSVELDFWDNLNIKLAKTSSI